MDIVTAKILVSAVLLFAVILFSLVTFEQGFTHMIRDFKAGRKSHVAHAAESDRSE